MLNRVILTLIFAVTISVSARMQATLFANPATTSSTSTLSVMINFADTVVPALTGGIRLKYPTTLSLNVACSVVEPATTVISSCTPSSSSNLLDIKFSNDVSGSTYLQLTQFLTPMTTTYTGFTVQTYDAQGVTLEQLDGVKLTSLFAQTLDAEISQKSSRLGAQTTFTLVAAPQTSCLSCALELTGPGLSQASCTGCKSIPFGLRLQTNLVADNTYTIEISDCLNPTTQLGSTYTVQVIDTLTGGSAEIAYLNVFATEPALLTSLSAEITGSTEIQILTSLQLSFTIPIQLETGCTIELKLPEDFTDVKEFMQKIQASGVFQQSESSIRDLPFTVMDSNLIRVRDACLLPIQAGEAGLSLSFVRNPSIVKPTGSLKVTISDKSQSPVCLSIDTISVTGFTPGSIESFKVQFGNKQVQSQTSATFEILPSHDLYPESFLLIEMPSEFKIAQSGFVTCSSLYTVSARSTPTCQITDNFIKISDLFYSAGYDPQTDKSLRIRVEGLGTTPDSVTPLKFSVSTYADLSQLVDSSTFTIDGILEPGPLEPTYYFSLNETNSYPTSINVYFTLTSRLPGGSSILLEVPKDIGLSTQPFCQGLRGFAGTCSIQVVSAQVLQITGLGQVTKAPGTKIVFMLGDLRLPRFQGSVPDLLQVTTMRESQVIDSGSVQLFVQTTSQIQNLGLQSGSLQNSAHTWLKFNFSLPDKVDLLNTDLIMIQLPQSISLPSSPQDCKLNTETVFCSIFTSNNTLVISSDALAYISGEISLEIPIINQMSFEPVSNFGLQVLDRSYRILATASTVQNLTYTTNRASTLAQLKMTQKSTQESVKTDYTFSSDVSLGTVLISLPDCMLFDSINLRNQAGLSIQYTLVSQHQLHFESKTNFTTVQGLANPSESCLQKGTPIKVQTFTDTTRLWLQSEATFMPSIACLGSCASCRADDRSQCTSCAGSYALFSGRCLDKCPSGLWQDQSSHSCIECPSGCLECSDHLTCTKCANDQVLSNETCIPASSCQVLLNHYISQGECHKCEAPCESCSRNGECLQCSKYTFLVQGTCEDTCPAQYELEGNTCTEQTAFVLVFGLFRLLPCTYSYSVIMIVLLLLKLVLKQRISFVMTNLMCVNVIMVGSLAYISQQNAILYEQTPTTQQCVMAFVPIGCLLLQFISNIWMSVVHRVVLAYSGYRVSILVYLPAVLLSYHCLSQVKLGRQAPKQASACSGSPLKQDQMVNSLLRYLSQYSLVSNIILYSCLTPTFTVLVYQTFLDTKAELLSQDACFIVAITALWLQLALYYPPEDNIFRVYILNDTPTEPEQIEESGDFELNSGLKSNNKSSASADLQALKFAKNSIQLQMIKQVSQVNRRAPSAFTDFNPKPAGNNISIPAMKTDVIKTQVQDRTQEHSSLSDIEIAVGSKTAEPSVSKTPPLIEYDDSFLGSGHSSSFSSAGHNDQSTIQKVARPSSDFGHFAKVTGKNNQSGLVQQSFELDQTTIDKTQDQMVLDESTETQLHLRYLTENKSKAKFRPSTLPISEKLPQEGGPGQPDKIVPQQSEHKKRSLFSKGVKRGDNRQL